MIPFPSRQAGGTLEAYLTCRAWAGQGSPPLWASVAPDLAGWCCSFPSPGGKVLVGVGPCRRCETHWPAMVWVCAWPSHPCPLSAPPPVAWVLCGGPCSAALAGMRTVPLLPDPSLPATATCGPVLCGMPATGAKCVRNPRRVTLSGPPDQCTLCPDFSPASIPPGLSLPCALCPMRALEASTHIAWLLVLPQLRRRVLCAGSAVCGPLGLPTSSTFPLPAGASAATNPAALWGPALPQLVHVILEGGEPGI